MTTHLAMHSALGIAACLSKKECHNVIVLPLQGRR